MSIALITGSNGLIGSESAHFFSSKGLDIVGVDNNMRQIFFGKEKSKIMVRVNKVIIKAQDLRVPLLNIPLHPI